MLLFKYRTTLGPRGMDKLVFNGNLTVIEDFIGTLLWVN